MPFSSSAGMMMVVRADGGWNLTAAQPQSTPQLGADLDFAALTQHKRKRGSRRIRTNGPAATAARRRGQAPVAWLNGVQGGPVVHEGSG